MSRGLALVTDGLLLVAAGFTLSAFLELVGVHHNPERLMAICLGVLWLPYSLWMLRNGGVTLGKRLAGLRVLRTELRVLDARRALRREFWRMVMAAGILWPVDYLAALGKRQATVHDRWSDTTVLPGRGGPRIVAPLLAAIGLFVVAAAMQYASHYFART